MFSVFYHKREFVVWLKIRLEVGCMRYGNIQSTLYLSFYSNV